jgi:hypothetical protein
MEFAAMMHGGELQPSASCLNALQLLMLRVPEIERLVRDWCAGRRLHLEGNASEPVKRVVDVMVPVAPMPEMALKRLHPESPQTVLPIDWSSVDFRGSGDST